MIYILIAGGAAVLDQVIKESMEGKPRSAFPHPAAGGRILLDRYHNPGIFLNIGASHPGRVKVLTTGVFAAVLAYFLYILRRPGLPLLKIAFAFITGGSAGNLADRLRRGYVVDYLRFRPRKIRRVIFNLGDLFLFTGIFLAILFLFSPER